MTERAWRCLMLGLTLAALALRAAPAQAARPQTPRARPAADTAVFCSAARVSAPAGDSVRVSARVVPADTAYAYAWSATNGRVVGSGPGVWWVLARPSGNAAPLDTVAVQVTRGGAAVGACRTRVAVTAPGGGRDGSDHVARAVLPRGQHEAAGYGHYTYLLLAGRPTDQAAAARQRAVVAAYLAQLEPIGAYADLLQLDRDPALRGQFSIMYAPVRSDPEADASWQNPADSAAVDAVLRAYDYAAARDLLSRFPGPHRRGPYLVSVRAPLTLGRAVGGPYAVQDLGVVPAGLVGDWVAQFLAESAQADFGRGWDPGRWSLRLSTAFAVLAQGIEPVAGGMAKWRQVFGQSVQSGGK